MAAAAANPLLSLALVLREMLRAIAPYPPPAAQKAAISRSAVFLCVFVVVHAVGNLTALGGRAAFNDCAPAPAAVAPNAALNADCAARRRRADAEALHGQKIFLLVELYLGLNVAGHAVLGVYKSLTNKFSRARLPPLPPPAASHQRHTRGPVERVAPAPQARIWGWTAAGSAPERRS